MRFGVYVPNFGEYADARGLATLACEAESAGWDGFFVYDHVATDAYGAEPGDPVCDPWIALAAVAVSTGRMRLGPLVTPVARRRPWKLARELVSLDRLSRGRLVFGVGLGEPEAFAPFGEDADARSRREKLDEALAVLDGLLAGEPFDFAGHHYTVRDARFLPTPIQRPRIPVWVAGTWPSRRPFLRAARFDGCFPLGRDAPLPSPRELRAIRNLIEGERGGGAPFDLVVAGATRGPTDTRKVAARERAGATWWLEWLEPERGTLAELRERVRGGPPRV